MNLLIDKYLCEKNSPLGKAIDHAKQWRITGDKKWIDKIIKKGINIIKLQLIY